MRWTCVMCYFRPSWPHLIQSPCYFFFSSFSWLWCILPGLGAATVANLNRIQCASLCAMLGAFHLSSQGFPRPAGVWGASGLAQSSLKHYSEVQGGGWEVGVYWVTSFVQWGTGSRGYVFTFPCWSHRLSSQLLMILTSGQLSDTSDTCCHPSLPSSISFFRKPVFTCGSENPT